VAGVREEPLPADEALAGDEGDLEASVPGPERRLAVVPADDADARMEAPLLLEHGLPADVTGGSH
jgi:hypothetical protein